jgi:N-acetylglucosaminyldiphosphoundecaprenol N-acetyl-beta-D-mannosaminyltransferase
MDVKIKEIFDTKFVDSDFTGFVDLVTKHLEAKSKTFIVTANPITVLNARDDHNFKAALETANYVTPDGIGILLAAKFLKKPLTERITGFDLMMRLLEVANQRSYSIYLYGAHPDRLQLAVKKINENYPNITVCGYTDGYQTGEENLKKLVAEIKEKKPDLIFVALGVPKQEIWIQKNIEQFDQGVFIGVGGSIDVLSGEVKRAPMIYQKLGIEWVYRMLSEPTRLKRISFIPHFFVETVKEKLK